MFCSKTFGGAAKSLIASFIAVASICLTLPGAPPAQAQSGKAVLFQNVRIFDGKSDALSPPSNVLVRDNKIEKISTAAMAADGAELSTEAAAFSCRASLTRIGMPCWRDRALSKRSPAMSAISIWLPLQKQRPH